MELGALLAGANVEEAGRCYNCGEKMGLSFQIMDDLLDAFGDHALVGKQKGGDILADKKTYLSLLAIEKDKNAFLSIVSQSNPEKKVEQMLQLYKELGVKLETEKLMESYYLEAVTELQELNASNGAKEPLKKLFDYLFERAF